MNILKSCAGWVHTAASKSPFAGLYLRGFGAVCRALPDAGWKTFVLNSLNAVQWPDVRLPPVGVRLPAAGMGVRLVPHFQEYDFQALIYRCLPYEPEVFRWLDTRDYRTVIEIGANVGVFSIFLARRFPQARVYAFEPSRKAFSRLLINAENNRCPNLVPFNAAVFSQSGFLTFHEPDGHLANGSLDRDFASLFSGKVKPVPVVAMSAVELESLVGEGPVLIKIDVEGVEPELLRTIQPLIARHRPDLLIEVLPYTEASLNELEFVRDGSYRLFRVEPQGLAPGQRFEAAKWRDWVALPSPASPNPGL